jgi:hypothetical protein
MAAMVWAVVAVIAVLGVGLPVAGWWITTRRPAPMTTPDRGRGEIDRWLAGQFGLGWGDRERVRAAVLAGKPVSGPALEAATREFADRVLARRFRALRTAQIIGRVELASGVAYFAFVLLALTLTSSHLMQAEGATGLIYAPVMCCVGWYQGFRGPSRVRRNAEQVLRSRPNMIGQDE